jgi:beta-glucanase (GH16 family)
MGFNQTITAALCAASLCASAASADERETIDPSKMTLTFEDGFDTLDVSANGPNTRWIAHVPWSGGDFGDAAFTDPTPDFPFTTRDGILRIEMRKDETGKWRSGLLSSVDPQGKGFSQQYGYFEMRAKLPKGPGVWPAFWLIGLHRSQLTSEVDVLEHYGAMPDRFSSKVHVWNRADRKKSKSIYKRTETPPGLIYNEFNTYGVRTDETWTTFYFNRRQIWRVKTPEPHRQPMYILMNLAAGSGWPIDKMPNPSYMYIDYVRVYRG